MRSISSIRARGAVVADAQSALHAGDRGTARLGHDLKRLVIQRIGFATALAVFRDRQTAVIHAATAGYHGFVIPADPSS